MTLANIPLDDSAPVSDAEVAVQVARAAGRWLQQFRRDFQTAAGTDPAQPTRRCAMRRTPIRSP